MMAIAFVSRTDRRWFTVQCGFGSWTACTATVEAASVEEACGLAVEAVNASDQWCPVDHCGAIYVDALAEGQNVEVWAHARSKIEVPLRFAEHGEVTALRTVLSRLVEWADQMGGWDAPCWSDARALLEWSNNPGQSDMLAQDEGQNVLHELTQGGDAGGEP